MDRRTQEWRQLRGRTRLIWQRPNPCWKIVQSSGMTRSLSCDPNLAVLLRSAPHMPTVRPTEAKVNKAAEHESYYKTSCACEDHDWIHPVSCTEEFETFHPSCMVRNRPVLRSFLTCPKLLGNGRDAFFGVVDKERKSSQKPEKAGVANKTYYKQNCIGVPLDRSLSYAGTVRQR